MRYNTTKELINALTGKNKAFITRVANHQEKKYGNTDLFSAYVLKDNMNGLRDVVTITFGDYWLDFYFRNGKIFETYGTGQGHKYHKSLEQCAIELYERN